ncbi:rho GTPase-activating protein 36 isoform 2-T4 [Alca torda]
MRPAALHSLSELERASLQEIALYQLQEKRLVGDLRLAKVGPKGSKSIRQKLESFSKEKKDCCPQTFGIPLFQVIANDRAYKQLQEEVKKSRRLCLEVEATVKRFQAQRQRRSPMGRSCGLVPCGAFPEEPLSPTFLNNSSWSQRRGAMSVDSIADLSDNTSKLLEALQLSHPHELGPRRSLGKTKMLSLNPITWQVPRIVERCCKHIETHGLQTVGIFRVGSSKKRVQQLREEFDQGLDVFLDEHQSVHDVAALLKEFLRDMPDPLIPRELYAAFLSTAVVSRGFFSLLSPWLLSVCCLPVLLPCQLGIPVAAVSHGGPGAAGHPAAAALPAAPLPQRHAAPAPAVPRRGGPARRGLLGPRWPAGTGGPNGSAAWRRGGPSVIGENQAELLESRGESFGKPKFLINPLVHGRSGCSQSG